MQQNNAKAHILEVTKLELPKTFFVFELQIKSGSSTELASRLNASDVVTRINESSPTAVSFHGFEDKIYAILQGEQISQTLESFEPLFEGLKEEAGNEIKLKLSSQNELGNVVELINKKGLIGWLDSLNVEFGFIKTNLIVKFLTIILEQILDLPQATGILKSFKQLNLELNCSRSRVLNEFPKIKYDNVTESPKNNFACILA
jgi:hypothetical protein